MTAAQPTGITAAAASSGAAAALIISPEKQDDTIVPDIGKQTLHRLTAGLPMHELDIIIKESTACEDALEREIGILEKDIGIIPNEQESGKAKNDAPELSSPLKEPSMTIPLLPQAYQPGGGINYLESTDAMLQTEFNPPDRYFTISALLGRLRDPLKLPYPPNSRLATAVQHQALPVSKTKKSDADAEKKKSRLALEKQEALFLLDKNEMYHREQPDTAALLALYKKISSHRTAAVFRKPVNPAEAPGYKERINFPMDLSLIRKMIVARMIKSFSSLHQRIALICHNCVKFNGRESDYAVLTRDFEDLVDDKVLEAVKNATATAVAAAAPPIPATVHSPLAPIGK